MLDMAKKAKREIFTEGVSIGRGRGNSRDVTPLIFQVYYNKTINALRIIEADPDQVPVPEYYTKLTPLHIAIERGNASIVKALLNNGGADVFAKDVRGRTAVDMLSYTNVEEIHDMILWQAYPDAMRRLEDEDYDKARAAGSVLPIKPKPPTP